MRNQHLIPPPGTHVVVSFTGTIINRPDIGGIGAVDIDDHAGLVRRLDGTEYVSELISNGITAPGGLSPRELEVLRLIAQGLSNPQIGFKLYITEDTVKAHVRTLMNKFNANNRLQLVIRALQRNVLKLGEIRFEEDAGTGQPPLRELSAGEYKLLPLLDKGLSIPEIALYLKCAAGTVEGMVRAIRNKWGVRSIEEIIALAHERGDLEARLG